ncbi:MAG: hypothetical protein VX252_10815 [Myxococcota bacterium]|nr:hypothetical protein [Myxococcota bacterium]
MTTSGTGQPDENVEWSSEQERGSLFWVRIALWGIRHLNPGCIRLFLPIIAFYYVVREKTARHSSREFLSRIAEISGQPRPGFRASYKHLHTFAQVILDRFTLWSGRDDAFKVVYHGLDHMQELLDRGKGAILVGAHLGSFDMLRLIARKNQIPVNVLMYVDNAQRINDAFEILDSDSMVRVISVDPDSSRLAFEVRKCVNRGEFIAVLADRVGPNAKKRVAQFEFLGERAPFPEGPFVLAHMLGLPIILTIALRRGSSNYEVFMERISHGEAKRGRERSEAVKASMALFVSRLEYYCLNNPMQWFNFFDFWSGDRNAD